MTKRLIASILICFILASCFCVPVSAFGNEWVYDETQVISVETEEYIKNLNETVFAEYKNKPQLSFFIVKDLPYSMNSYKNDLFNEFGVGTKNENCGMLFVFALNDREYGFEIGDGFKKGSLLRKDLEKDFITNEMKDFLRAENYDAVVFQIAQHLEKIMANEENGVYAEKEAQLIKQQKAQEEARKKAEQEREAKAAARAEAFKANIVKFLKFLGLAVSVVGIVVIVGMILSAFIRKKKIANLMEYHKHYLFKAKTNADEFANHLNEQYADMKTAELDENFLKILYEYYQKKMVACIPNGENAHLYKKRFLKQNDFSAFKAYQIVDLEKIMHDVDAEEHKKAETRRHNQLSIEAFFDANKHRIQYAETEAKLKQILQDYVYSDRFVTDAELELVFATHLRRLNREIEEEQRKAEMLKTNAQHIETFYDTNKHRILNPAIADKLKVALRKCNRDYSEVSDSELEEVFVQNMNSMNFDFEFDQFIQDNRDSIDTRYFNRNDFYNSVRQSSHYHNYQYRGHCNYGWMMPLLMSHTRHNREEAERRAARKRQQQQEAEAARRRQQQQRLNASASSARRNSPSYGRSFGSGRSSGGGFKGGW